MSFLRRLLGFGRPSAEDIFLHGRDAFAAGDYGSALSFFEKAAKKFGSNEEMRISSLMNAATAAQYAGIPGYATELYYSVALRRLKDEDGTKSALDPLEKAFNSALQVPQYPEVTSEILTGLFLLKIIIRRLEDVRKLVSYTRALENDDFVSYIEIIWQAMTSETPKTLTKFPSINLPKVFHPYQIKAENILRGYLSLSIGLPYSESKYPEELEVGDPFAFESSIFAFAPLEITKIHLSSGAKGLIVKEPALEFPVDLSKGSTLPLKYTLQPQVSGEWEIGPLTISYRTGKDEFEYPSKKIVAIINPKKALITAKIIPECITEDFEYNLDIQVFNESEGVAEGIEVSIETPAGVEIVTGTSWKRLASLSPHQNFNFTVNLRFDVSSRITAGHEILVKITHENSVIHEKVVIGE